MKNIEINEKILHPARVKQFDFHDTITSKIDSDSLNFIMKPSLNWKEINNNPNSREIKNVWFGYHPLPKIHAF